MQKFDTKSNFKFCFTLWIFAFLILNFTGCATIPGEITTPKIKERPGIYHSVEKGQTLWGISKMYNIDLETLVSANHITDSASIEIGQRILIPKTQSQPKTSFRVTTGEDDFMWPTRGKILSTFGTTHNNTLNKGIDIQPYSDSDVFASRSGRVVFCNPDFRGYGKTIIIDHGDGFWTIYSRNAELLVKTGDSVHKGSIIAKIGSTGSRDKRPYLHFEIRKAHLAQNPSFYLPH